MNLIIFDIDGTLTQTNKVDSACFVKAIKDTLQIHNLNTDWASYQYSTDSGLLNEIYTAFLKRLPLEEEINLVKSQFLNHLKIAWLEDKMLYAPVAGATTLFEKISALSNWQIALATGGWEPSALFKLTAAGIPHEKLSKAFAEDHIERTEIIKTAIQRAKILHTISHYQRIIYVGDKEWDRRAANSLNIEFVGVGNEFDEEKLSQGLSLQSYEPNTALLKYLEVK